MPRNQPKRGSPLFEFCARANMLRGPLLWRRCLSERKTLAFYYSRLRPYVRMSGDHLYFLVHLSLRDHTRMERAREGVAGQIFEEDQDYEAESPEFDFGESVALLDLGLFVVQVDEGVTARQICQWVKEALDGFRRGEQCTVFPIAPGVANLGRSDSDRGLQQITYAHQRLASWRLIPLVIQGR